MLINIDMSCIGSEQTTPTNARELRKGVISKEYGITTTYTDVTDKKQNVAEYSSLDDYKSACCSHFMAVSDEDSTIAPAKPKPDDGNTNAQAFGGNQQIDSVKDNSAIESSCYNSRSSASSFGLPEHKRVMMLGSGGFGSADLMIHQPTNLQVVCKTFRLKNTKEPDEVDIMRTLFIRAGHRHICAYLHYFHQQPDLTHGRLMLEYCDQGDLHYYRRRHEKAKQKVSESFLWHVMVQLSSALAFLHTGLGTKYYDDHSWDAVLHRDIKPRNIFLKSNPDDPSGFPTIKLGDFGLASFESNEVSMGFHFGGGTCDYMPPERPIANKAGDVWGLGATIHYLATGAPPINMALKEKLEPHLNTDDWQILQAIPRQVQKLSMWPQAYARSHYEVYSPGIDYWMHRCLELDQNMRITAEQLVLCPHGPNGWLAFMNDIFRVEGHRAEGSADQYSKS
jgi:hypothetical protein